MLPVPPNSSERDIKRWLSTVFVVDDGNTKTPAYYSHMSEDGSVYCYKVGPNRIEEPCVVVPLAHCFAHWPKLGYLNEPGANRAVYYSRVVSKHWVRSVCAAALRMYTVDGTQIPLFDSNANYLVLPFVPSPYASFRDAVAGVRNGTYSSVAVSRHVALGASVCPTKISLYVKGALAGYILGNDSVYLTSDEHRTLLSKAIGSDYDIAN